MTPERIAKIQALADDVRGHPMMRRRAQEKLAEIRRLHPDLFPQPRPKPGMHNSEEYERFRFMDLSTWGRTANGNLVHVVTVGSKRYRVVLFPHKKTPTFGYLIIDLDNDAEEFSRVKYSTQSEAHRWSWERLVLKA